tara:strand:- start:145224 stop:145760 length:537 start_codon:yes stop_codon:yes gene_type:complete
MGAWPIGVSGVITVFIAILAAVKRSDISITRADWLFLLAALASLPFWYFTSNPLWAVVVLTVVDLLGFGPTIRKAYNFLHQENIPFFVLFMARNTFSLLALEHYSFATALFPLSVGCVCLFLVVMVSYRRKVVCLTRSPNEPPTLHSLLFNQGQYLGYDPSKFRTWSTWGKMPDYSHR